MPQSDPVGEEPENLSELLRREMAESGPMPFERFMRLALYHPRWGYYAGRGSRIGRGGDYVTAPATGRIFGRLLAGQFAETWGVLGRPERLDVIEQGAGDGWLLRDILGAARDHHPQFFRALRVHLIEPLEPLRARQAASLADFGLQATWHDSEEGLPLIDCGIHFSNELLDAMPVHWVESDGASWREMHVRTRGGPSAGFETVALPITSTGLAGAVAARLPWRPAGFRAEVGLAASRWAGGVASRLRSGLILVLDYGLPRCELHAETRPQGTLRTYSKHRQGRNPLASPGDIDITAHVDFTAVVEACLAHGWRLAGFADQHHFLIAAGDGLLREWEKHRTLDDVPAFKALTHPSGMGTSFHALGLAKGLPTEGTGPPSGFAFSRPSDIRALMSGVQTPAPSALNEMQKA